MSTTNPIQFLQQVRAEVAKVVWPTRREVLLTTLMVFILSALAATFFSLVDLGIRTALCFLFRDRTKMGRMAWAARKQARWRSAGIR